MIVTMRDLFSSSDDEDEDPVPAITTVSHIRSDSAPRSDNTEEDGKYFNFFLSELSNCFPYVKLFPWAAAKLFVTSNHNPALRQSVLAVAALIAENDLRREHTQALEHLQKALQILRSNISTVEIDEGVAI